MFILNLLSPTSYTCVSPETTMQLAAGTRLTHYQITGPLGQGGMGAVYRAVDMDLGRDVAIKVLPAEFAADPERLARFDREARVLASLNHPHIASIYEVGRVARLEARDSGPVSQPFSFIVMELVRGETLEIRMARGPIPMEEAIAISKQIAEALDAAHEKGIIHRDLKPANIMIDEEGRVKVLDFGLARAAEAEEQNADLSNSPTLMRAGTHAGVILGTAGYMSPEQARGKRVDKRADIWSFGVVLYEMLTGSRLFDGETVSDTLAAVLTRDIDLKGLPSRVPTHVRRVLARCLERDPRRRIRDIGDVRLELEGVGVDTAGVRQAGSQSQHAARWPLIAIGALLIACALLAALLFRRPEAEERILHANIPLPPGTRLGLSGFQPGPPAISPDGSRVVFSADGPGPHRRLWVRDLASRQARVIEGTEGASYPFWSFDGQHIGFFTDENLLRVPAAGGTPLIVVHASNAKGGAWSRDDIILFTPEFNSPLHRVPATGGTSTPVTKVNTAAGESSHRFPQFLPDGKRFLYFTRNRSESGNRTMLGSLDSTASEKIVDSDTNATLAGGHLFYLRGRTLVVHPFDEKRGKLVGSPVPVTDNVRTVPGGWAVIAAADRILLFQTGDAFDRKRLQWVDRTGKLISEIGEPVRMGDGALSADGKSCLATVDNDIWAIDTTTGNRERLTFDTATEFLASWSPDRSQFVFSSNADGPLDLRLENMARPGTPEVLVPNRNQDRFLRASSWAADGSMLLIEDENLKTNSTTIAVLDVRTPRTMRSLTQVSVRFPNPQFSPDGRWISFSTLDANGRTKIFVAAFPAVQRRWEVAPGTDAFWSGDGSELFFTDSGGQLQKVEIKTAGQSVTWSPVTTLFLLDSPLIGVDGDRFLIAREASEGMDAPLEMIQNWRALLPKGNR